MLAQAGSTCYSGSFEIAFFGSSILAKDLVPLQVADFAKARAGTFPKLVWKDTGPQHFDNPPYGYYEQGSVSTNKDCKPVNVTLKGDGSLQATQDGLQLLLEGGATLTLKILLLFGACVCGVYFHILFQFEGFSPKTQSVTRYVSVDPARELEMSPYLSSIRTGSCVFA